jgi:hypothetical protein
VAIQYITGINQDGELKILQLFIPDQFQRKRLDTTLTTHTITRLQPLQGLSTNMVGMSLQLALKQSAKTLLRPWILANQVQQLQLAVDPERPLKILPLFDTKMMFVTVINVNDER